MCTVTIAHEGVNFKCIKGDKDKIYHDFACKENVCDMQNPLYAKLERIRNTTDGVIKTNKKLTILVNERTINFVNVDEWYIDNIRTEEWMELRKEDLEGRELKFLNFVLLWWDVNICSSKERVEWLYDRYGGTNVRFLLIHNEYIKTNPSSEEEKNTGEKRFWNELHKKYMTKIE